MLCGSCTLQIMTCHGSASLLARRSECIILAWAWRDRQPKFCFCFHIVNHCDNSDKNKVNEGKLVWSRIYRHDYVDGEVREAGGIDDYTTFYFPTHLPLYPDACS